MKNDDEEQWRDAVVADFEMLEARIKRAEAFLIMATIASILLSVLCFWGVQP